MTCNIFNITSTARSVTDTLSSAALPLSDTDQSASQQQSETAHSENQPSHSSAVAASSPRTYKALKQESIRDTLHQLGWEQKAAWDIFGIYQKIRCMLVRYTVKKLLLEQKIEHLRSWDTLPAQIKQLWFTEREYAVLANNRSHPLWTADASNWKNELNAIPQEIYNKNSFAKIAKLSQTQVDTLCKIIQKNLTENEVTQISAENQRYILALFSIDHALYNHPEVRKTLPSRIQKLLNACDQSPFFLFKINRLDPDQLFSKTKRQEIVQKLKTISEKSTDTTGMLQPLQADPYFFDQHTFAVNDESYTDLSSLSKAIQQIAPAEQQWRAIQAALHEKGIFPIFDGRIDSILSNINAQINKTADVFLAPQPYSSSIQTEITPDPEHQFIVTHRITFRLQKGLTNHRQRPTIARCALILRYKIHQDNQEVVTTLETEGPAFQWFANRGSEFLFLPMKESVATENSQPETGIVV